MKISWSSRRKIYFAIYIIISVLYQLLFILWYICTYLKENEIEILRFLIPVQISANISITYPIYRYLLEKSKLSFDLEKGRNYLIKIFDITDTSESPNPKAKYLRINLVNKGNITAKNCSVKLYIYYSNKELIREPSNLYPSGYHIYKQEGKNPPLIDIAAGDSQIYDICSSMYDANPFYIRFEDYYTHSRINAKNYYQSFRDHLYIELFAYSDNTSPIKKEFKIYRENKSKELQNWQKINIKEFEWKKLKSKTKNKVNRYKKSMEKFQEEKFDKKLDDNSDKLSSKHIEKEKKNNSSFYTTGAIDENK